MDAAQTAVLNSDGNYGWSGAAATNFWVDPRERLVGIIMTQLMDNMLPFQQDFPRPDLSGAGGLAIVNRRDEIFPEELIRLGFFRIIALIAAKLCVVTITSSSSGMT